MYITNVPLILTSLAMSMPYFVGMSLGNYWTAACWGVLTTTSTLVHLTKRPFHLYGDKNVIPWLYAIDVLALNTCAARAIVDGWQSGPFGLLLTAIVLGYSALIFYGGRAYQLFVYDIHNPIVAIVTHMSVHIVSALGGTALLYVQAFKNGERNS